MKDKPLKPEDLRISPEEFSKFRVRVKIPTGSEPKARLERRGRGL